MLRNYFLFGLALLFYVSAFSQHTQSAGIASKEYPQDIQDIQMAGKLIKYGYQKKSALSLIQAVEIFKRYNICEVSPERPKEEKGDDIESNISKTDVVSFDEKQLLADATKFADGNKTLLSLIQDVGKSTRGVTPKRKEIRSRIQAGKTDTWRLTFRGDELAMVMVIGDGDTDLDLFIYDDKGNLIDCDENPDDNCTCSFIPQETGTIVIKIVNNGRIYNNYVLITN